MAKSLKQALSVLTFVACALFGVHAGAEPEARTFALIVANNRSLSLALPDLQYADDDAARYHRLFSASGTEPRVELLTTFDRNSETHYPTLKTLARPATKRNVVGAVARLQRELRLARGRGERTIFYFVFAGHGEVAGGKGYLHLEDVRIDGAFIEREIIEKLRADEMHVLLDSCNSFFVINPRKPGGRRWATPKDMALGFSARHPEVGLFLSTNSDEEVFEWSEIESGVFSHEVRSGLTGAADVNGDGAVTYSELGGFIARANAGIGRETLRPQVYFSGPRGNPHARLFSTRSLSGRRVELGSAQSRIWVRSETGERLVDLHKEPGELGIVLPAATEHDLSIFVQSAGATPGAPPLLVEHALARGSDTVRLSELAAGPPLVASRGHRLFGTLFSLPYGPISYAEFEKTRRSAPEPVYGVREEDVTRMGNYVRAMADLDRFQRSVSAVTFGAVGGLLGGVVIAGQFAEPKIEREATIGGGAAAAAFLGLGLYLGLTDSTGEKALEAFESELRAGPTSKGLAFARTEEKLEEIADNERTRRQVGFWSMQLLGAGLATLSTVALLDDSEREEPGVFVSLYGSAALMSGLGFYILASETPVERMLRLYREDPGTKLRTGAELRFGVAPVRSGGMAFGVSGSF